MMHKNVINIDKSDTKVLMAQNHVRNNIKVTKCYKMTKKFDKIDNMIVKYVF